MFGCTTGLELKKVEGLYEKGFRDFVFPLVPMEKFPGGKLSHTGTLAYNTTKADAWALKKKYPDIRLFLRAPAWISLVGEGELFDRSVECIEEQMELAVLMPISGYILGIGCSLATDLSHEDIVKNVVKVLRELPPQVPILLENSPANQEATLKGGFATMKTIVEEINQSNVGICFNTRNAWSRGDHVLVSMASCSEVVLERFGLLLQGLVKMVVLTPTPQEVVCGSGMGAWALTPSLPESKGLPVELLKRIFQLASKRGLPVVVDRPSDASLREDLLTMKEWARG